MAPRLHRPIRHDQEEAQPAHGDGTPIPVLHLSESELAHLLDFLGVNDLAHVQGTTDRTKTLAPGSTVVCPTHDRVLVPDACRSCRFLAGER